MFCLIYITCSNHDEAQSIAKVLLGEGLIACANILGEVHSNYVWQGELCEDTEVSMILKTKEDKYDQVASRVQELHSYDCPCIFAIPVLKLNDQCATWLSESVK